VQIVIGTTPDRSNWLAECAASIGRPFIAVSNYGYELGKIRWVMENTNIERFLFLQDSVIIKSDAFWDLLEGYDGSVSINQDPTYYGSYMGVYERAILKHLDLPVMETKRDAVTHEVDWARRYIQVGGIVPVMFPTLRDGEEFEVHHGRMNMVIENDYIKKYKGTWSYDQL
jgi:hypothetical protein